MSEENEVIVPGTTAVATVKNDMDNAPAFIEPATEGIGAGFENAGEEIITRPMVLLAQAMSPQVAKELMKPGDVFLNVDDTVLFNKTQQANIMPFFYHKKWVEWAPRGGTEKQSVLDQSTDPESEIAARSRRREEREDGEYAITEYHIYHVCFEGNLEDPVVIPFYRTKWKVGKKFMTLALRRGAKYPLYAGKYSLRPVQETNKAQQIYYNFEVANNGWVTEEEYKVLKGYHEQCKEIYGKIQLDLGKTHSSNESTSPVIVTDKGGDF